MSVEGNEWRSCQGITRRFRRWMSYLNAMRRALRRRDELIVVRDGQRVGGVEAHRANSLISYGLFADTALVKELDSRGRNWTAARRSPPTARD